MSIRDALVDLVSHTYELGNVDTIKVTGDGKSTVISALAEDRSAVIEGELAIPIADFEGLFGMVNLGKLKVLLNLPEYREGAKISVARKDTGEAEALDFKNAKGDFKNNYRFMSAATVEEKLKTPKFRGANWDVTFTPTQAAIQRLKMQAQANAEETTFQVKTEDGNLKLYFGDHSTHAGNFVFHAGIEGELQHTWSWPIKTVISILELSGDKVFQISSSGAAQIIVDSGVATYKYILPAQQK
jgi:hypothetical protein